MNDDGDVYQDFLVRKSQVAGDHGFDPLWMPDFLFDFQKCLVEWAIRKGRAAIFADCGLGKGVPPKTPVLTESGFVPIGSLRLGDAVIASDGKPYPVRGVYERPLQSVWRVWFSDGSCLVVDADHLHICRTNNDRQRGKPWRIMSTRDLLKRGNLRYGRDGKSRNYDIPVVAPVEFAKRAPSYISSYAIGALLGDGSLSQESMIGFTSADEYVVKTLAAGLSDGCTVRKKSQIDYRLNTGGGGGRRHPLRVFLRKIGMVPRLSHEKSVPKEYLIASVQDRLMLLRGLMDTDGYIMNCGTSQFSSASRRLAEDVEFLVRSLGGVPTFHRKRCYLDGKRMRDAYSVTFSLATCNPFGLPRKAAKWNRSPRDNGRWIDRIEPAGESETICIVVDSPDQSYVARDFIVTHNTPISLVWAENVVRKTDRSVLILTPLAVARQFVREGDKFGIGVHYAREGDAQKGINVVNYQRLHYFDPSDFAGLVCDESGVLKHHDAKTRQAVSLFCSRIPYRLLGTATPAPNDFMELGNSAEVLGVMRYAQMLGMFFVNDGETSSQWRLKGHAKKKFWQWVSIWARAVRKPSDLGFDDDGFILPPLTVQHHTVAAAGPEAGVLFNLAARTLNEQRRERRRTLKQRCEKVAEVCPSDRAFIVWCQLNAEGDLLEKLLPDAVQVKGSDDNRVKEERLDGFARGQIRVLVTKPKIGGWGLNLQCCSDVAYFPSHSWEAWYQAVRRCWRFGQEREVTVNVVASEAELLVIKNMERKERQSSELYDGIIHEMEDFQLGQRKEKGEQMMEMEVPSWL